MTHEADVVGVFAVTLITAIGSVLDKESSSRRTGFFKRELGLLSAMSLSRNLTLVVTAAKVPRYSGPGLAKACLGSCVLSVLERGAVTTQLLSLSPIGPEICRGELIGSVLAKA